MFLKMAQIPFCLFFFFVRVCRKGIFSSLYISLRTYLDNLAITAYT